MNSTHKVAVIGAGLSGLACAYELQRAGIEVVVLEKESVVGGRTASRASHGLPFDCGAQIVSMSYLEALRYSRELGIEWEWAPIPKLTHHLYLKGELHLATYDNLSRFLRYSYLSPLARTRFLLFFAWLMYRARHVDFFDLTTSAHLDTQNAYDYAVRWGGQEVADYVVDTLVAAYHFHHAREIGLGAFLGCLNHFTRYFTFHRLTKGIGALAESLAARLPIHTSTPALSVQAKGGKVAVTTPDETLLCDSVVIATPGTVTRQIYPSTGAHHQLLSAVQYASTISVSFRVPAEPLGKVCLVVVPESESSMIASYVLPLKGGVQRDEGEMTLLNVFLRDALSQQLMRRSNSDILSLVKNELLKVCPPLKSYADKLEVYDLQRWTTAMPKYYAGYVHKVREFWNKGQGEHNVFLCGDYLNTPWIEGSIRCGQRVSELIKKRF